MSSPPLQNTHTQQVTWSEHWNFVQLFLSEFLLSVQVQLFGFSAYNSEKIPILAGYSVLRAVALGARCCTLDCMPALTGGVPYKQACRPLAQKAYFYFPFFSHSDIICYSFCTFFFFKIERSPDDTGISHKGKLKLMKPMKGRHCGIP